MKRTYCTTDVMSVRSRAYVTSKPLVGAVLWPTPSGSTLKAKKPRRANMSRASYPVSPSTLKASALNDAPFATAPDCIMIARWKRSTGAA